MIDNFDIATDLKVEMFLPINIINPFIIGISILGGPDVLDGDLFPETDWDWVSVEATVANAQISIGGSLESNLYFQPDSGSLTLQLQTYDYDPSVNSAIRAGTKIRVRLDDGIIDQTLFSGFIDTINVSYSAAGSQPNIIDIQARDIYKRVVNTRLASFDNTTNPAGYATPLEVFTQAVTDAGFIVSGDSEVLPGKLPLVAVDNPIANTFINDATLVGLGVAWVDPATDEIVIKNRPSIETPPTGTWIIGNNHGDDYHLCMSDITVNADQNSVYNSLKVAMSTDETTFVIINDDVSIDLYGEMALDILINTTDSTELTAWGEHAFSSSPTKLVNSVTTPAIDRQGTLTAAAGFLPGTLIGVKYNRNPLNIDAYYTIIKVNHEINVDNWFTTLELWKGQ